MYDEAEPSIPSETLKGSYKCKYCLISILWSSFAPTRLLNCVANAISLFVLCEYVGITLTTGALGTAFNCK